MYFKILYWSTSRYPRTLAVGLGPSVERDTVLYAVKANTTVSPEWGLISFSFGNKLLLETYFLLVRGIVCMHEVFSFRALHGWPLNNGGPAFITLRKMNSAIGFEWPS